MLDLEKDASELLERAKRALRYDARIGPSLSEEEREDLASDTYERLLRRHRRGQLHNRGLISLTQTTALNLARNYLAHRNFQGPGDPSSEDFVRSGHVDAPDEALFRKVDLVGGIEAAEQLPEEQKRVYRALVVDELRPAEAIRRLRMRRSTFFKYRKLAFDHVTSALLETEESPAAQQRHRLLAAYDAGTANARERARARRLLKTDPLARAELLALRRGHEVAAVGLPVASIAQSMDAGYAEGIVERLAAAAGRGRDALSNAVHRYGGDAADTPAAIAGSGAGRGAGAAGAAILGKIAAAGTGAQVAGVCVGGGGAALVACLATGVIALPSSGQSLPDDEVDVPRREEVARERAFEPVATMPSQVGHPAPRVAETQRPEPREATDQPVEPPDDVVPDAPEPVVAPTASAETQEFGVAAAATPATGPAPADTNDSNGASAGTVRQEFGP